MGLIKTAAKAAVASSVHGRVQRRQQQRWAEQDQAAPMQTTQPGLTPQPPDHADVAPFPPPTHSPPPLRTGDKIALLKDLTELRDAGALTEPEFETEKRKLLDG